MKQTLSHRSRSFLLLKMICAHLRPDMFHALPADVIVTVWPAVISDIDA